MAADPFPLLPGDFLTIERILEVIDWRARHPHLKRSDIVAGKIKAVERKSDSETWDEAKVDG